MRRRQMAFTLIELLVVVAIIITLVAILLPSLGNARKQAKSAVCQSNIRQMGIACRLYAEENYLYWPAHTTWSTDGLLWYDRLRPYIPNDASRMKTVSLTCPEFLEVRSGAATLDAKGNSVRTGYHFNANLGYRSSAPAGYCRITSFTNAEGRIPFTWDDVQTQNVEGGWPADYSYWAGSWYQFSYRHTSNTLNLGMVDGHVETVKQPVTPRYIGTVGGGGVGTVGSASDYAQQYVWNPFNTDDR